MSKQPVDTHKKFPDVCHFRYFETKWAKLLCHRENSCFLKPLFLSISWVQNNDLINAECCRNTLWTLTDRSVTFVMLQIGGKNGQKLFSS